MHEVAIYLKKNCTFNTVEMATTSKCQWINSDYVWYLQTCKDLIPRILITPLVSLISSCNWLKDISIAMFNLTFKVQKYNVWIKQSMV